MIVRTKGQRADINEKNTLASLFTREDTTLNSGTVGNGLVGVDSLGRLLAVKVIFEELLNLGNSGRSTNEDNLVISYLSKRAGGTSLHHQSRPS
jgi:hypothetical protein